MGAKLPPTLTQIYALRYTFNGAQMIFENHAALRAAFNQARRIAADSELVARHAGEYAGHGLTTAQLGEKTCVVYHNLQQNFLAAAQVRRFRSRAGPRPFPRCAQRKERRPRFHGGRRANERAPARPSPSSAPPRRKIRNSTAPGPRNSRPAAPPASKSSCLAGSPPPKSSPKSAAPASSFSPRSSTNFLVPSSKPSRSAAQSSPPKPSAPLYSSATPQAGQVVPPADPAALARAMTEILANNETYAKNARAIAPRLAHELSSHAIALQIARHLSEIVS